jgi:hypothetical protein
LLRPEGVGGVNASERLTSLAHSARWLAFAKTADDRRRRRYWEAAARLRGADMARRRRAVGDLIASPVELTSQRGFTTSDGSLFPLVEAVVNDVRRRRRELAIGVGEKPYLLDHPLTSLERASPLVQFALDPRVVAAAAHYLGIVPLLTGVTILASPPVPGPFSGSQLFHSDWEDVRQVKVFVNCSSVAEENGPLTAVTADASRRVKRTVGYRYGGPHFRLRDDEVLPLVGDGEVQAFTGPPGSVVFIDTSSCLHLGSRVRDGAEERLVVQFQYLTPPAFDLLLAPAKRRPFAGAAGSAPLDHLVLG